MKNLLYLLLFFCPYLLFGQAEKVYSIVTKSYPVDYYATQAKLWKQKVDQSNSPEAWFNYYTAVRMENILKSERVHDLDAIIEACLKAIPNTYEAHYMYAWNKGYTPDVKAHLKKAMKINPERHEAWYHMLSFSIQDLDLEGAQRYAKKIYEQKAFSPGIVNWNYNMLMSLDKDAILLTQGDNDTYPSQILSYAEGIRTDVTVINYHMLLHYKDYRDNTFRKLGIAPLDLEEEAVARMSTSDKYRLLCRHIKKDYKNPLYISCPVSRQIQEDLSDSLYLEGLAFRYSSKPYDNIPILVDNYENRFMMDYLSVTWQPDISESVLRTMNMNYLPALMSVLRHYQENDMPAQFEKVKALSLAIGQAGGREKVVKKYIANLTQQGK
ncbi:MAG: hypothetical protein AAGG75_08325 [Bacteroidota bacterium]